MFRYVSNELEIYKSNFIGVHRQLGTHITKVKSVNLDKWPPGKVDLFRALSNDMVNSYWEKNMPKTYRKPDSNASNHEVT